MCAHHCPEMLESVLHWNELGVWGQVDVVKIQAESQSLKAQGLLVKMNGRVLQKLVTVYVKLP